MKLDPAKPFHRDLLSPIRAGDNLDPRDPNRFLDDHERNMAEARSWIEAELSRKRALLGQHYGVDPADSSSLLDAVLPDLLPGFRVVPWQFGRGRPPEWGDKEYMLLVGRVSGIMLETGKSARPAVRELMRRDNVTKYTEASLYKRYLEGLEPERNGFIAPINRLAKSDDQRLRMFVAQAEETAKPEPDEAGDR